MADYPEALESDPDGVSTALEVGATFWHRGDYSDAVKWLRKAVDAAFDEGADDRGLALSKVAALLATTVPTTPAPPPPSTIPEPVEPEPMRPVPPAPRVVERAPEVPPPADDPEVEMVAGERPALSSSGLPLPRRTGRPTSREVFIPKEALAAREAQAPRDQHPATREHHPATREVLPPAPSATRTIQGTGGPRESSMLTPFAMPMRVPTPARAPTPRAVEASAQEINERTPTRPLDEPSVEELVHSAFPDPIEEPPKPRVRTRLWNSTDALRVAVSRDGEKTVLRMFDGTDLAEGEIEAVLVGLSGGPELAEMLRVFGDDANSSGEKG